jgi:hypothetical protein
MTSEFLHMEYAAELKSGQTSFARRHGSGGRGRRGRSRGRGRRSGRGRYGRRGGFWGGLGRGLGYGLGGLVYPWRYPYGYDSYGYNPYGWGDKFEDQEHIEHNDIVGSSDTETYDNIHKNFENIDWANYVECLDWLKDDNAINNKNYDSLFNMWDGDKTL